MLYIHLLSISSFFLNPNGTSITIKQQFPIPLSPPSLITSNLCSIPMTCVFQIFNISEIIQYLSFCLQRISLSIFSKFIMLQHVFEFTLFMIKCINISLLSIQLAFHICGLYILGCIQLWIKNTKKEKFQKVEFVAFPDGSVVKNPPANTGDADSIPVLGRSPGEGNDNPLPYSYLENSINRGAWQAMESMGLQKFQT